MKKTFFFIGLGFLLLLFVIWLSWRLLPTIIARFYLGDEETGANAGFESKRFEKQMIKIGWRPGDAWCAFFVKLIWTKSHPFRSKQLDNLISGNTYQTLANFENDNSGNYEVSDKPTRGAIVIFDGHTGIVTGIKGQTVKTIEGNTSDKVARREHTLGQEYMKFIRMKI